MVRRTPIRCRRPLALVLSFALALVGLPGAEAAEVKIFEVDTQASFLAGTLDGISVDPLGRLRLADRVERVASIDEPFLLSAALLPDGWVVGTGNAGRVLKVDREGMVSELFAAPEPEIFAVWADADGTVYAGSSPRGKVYRIPAAATGGAAPTSASPTPEAAAFFDPGETYIWLLARDSAGRLLVATGTEGKLYRVDAEGTGTVIYDGDDTHLRSLLPLPGGEVLLGTASEGLVQLLTARRNGRGEEMTARTLYDAPEPEVVALASGPDGLLWAAVAASEASLVEVAPSEAGDQSSGGESKGDKDDEKDGGGAVVIVDGGGSNGGAGSRPRSFSGARSRLVSIERPSRVESRWSFERETVFALGWQRGRLWVGTGLEGKLYSWDGNHMVLEKDVDEGQIVALLAGDSGPAFATTNAAALYRVSGGIERRGIYTSAPLDAGQAARFGTFRWRGEIPAGAGLELSFRSGLSAHPDRTWSEWSEWQRAASPPRGDTAASAGRHGGETALADLDAGRYVQWRARFSSSGDASPRLFAVELSYRQQNLRPRIERFAVLDPGEILVAANFNPSNQVYEPASPNRDGIFTTLEPASENGGSRLKTLWKKGFRSLRWQVADDNDDELTYRLTFRPESGRDGAASNGSGWLPMVADFDEDHFSFDSTALPDGLYRFRLEASDAEANEEGQALTADRVSEPVVVDNTPPGSIEVERRSGGLRVTVSDDWNPLRSVEVSIDGKGWEPLRPVDGLLDGRRETLNVEVPEEAQLVLLRVEDAAFNLATFDLSSF